jgi:hypothetical protein
LTGHQVALSGKAADEIVFDVQAIAAVKTFVGNEDDSSHRRSGVCVHRYLGFVPSRILPGSG